MPMHAPLQPLRIGLTGGIGSGKSTVAQMLQSQGAALIDADAIARLLTAPNGAAMAQIANAFGPEFVDATGALDRDRMRTHVFAHADAKLKLEAIIHPLVSQETQRQAFVATQAGHTTLVFDVPLLVESGRWRSLVDRVLVIDCTVETQIQRVMARNGMTRTAVQAIIDAQASRKQRLAAADWVVFNDNISREALAQDITTLTRQSLAR